MARSGGLFFPMSISSRIEDFLHKYNVEIHSANPIKKGITEWIAMDYEFTFEENLKNYPEYLEYYIKNPIYYRVNKQYFRSSFNFKSDKSKKVNLFLGCSHTFGIGLHWEHTWPYLLSKHIEGDIINLGIPGGGIEATYITLKKYIDYYDVQNIFHLQPIYARYLVFDENKLNTFLPHHIDKEGDPLGFARKYYNIEYFKELFYDPDYMVYSHLHNLDAIKYTASKNNIPYFYSNNLPAFIYPSQFKDAYGKKVPKEVLDAMKNDILARDLAHPPLSTNKQVSNSFLEYYKKHPEGYSTL